MDRQIATAPTNGNVDHDFAAVMTPHHRAAQSIGVDQKCCEHLRTHPRGQAAFRTGLNNCKRDRTTCLTDSTAEGRIL